MSDLEADADLIRATERNRLRALVDADMEVARQLHADDFQLITPSGGALSKEDYLGLVASGEVDYLLWEPETIEEIVLGGRPADRAHCWHTDAYEKRDGRWQVVWSHATEIT